MGNVKINDKIKKDITFGYAIAKRIADMDIGQTVIVKNNIVVAVEAQEGTDKCIIRGAKIAGRDFIVIKVARTKQDFRYDVPVVGEKTINLIKRYKGSGIVIEAKKTFILNKENVIKKANNSNIFIYAI